MRLEVLLVEDTQEDLEKYQRDLPAVFRAEGLDVTLHPVGAFDEALERVRDPHRRYDLIVSDTYRGPATKGGDAAVLTMIDEYRERRFCPLVVFSASAKPAALKESPFVLWADKTPTGDLEKKVRTMLRTGIPQAARALHDDLDREAGSYLWEFLDRHWRELEDGGFATAPQIARLVRRRAAFQLAEVVMSTGGAQRVAEVHGHECYLYPPIEAQYSLGQIVRHKANRDIRVVVTPHCYLTIQPNQDTPRAEFVRLIKTVPVDHVFPPEAIKKLQEAEEPKRGKTLGNWTRSPVRDPAARRPEDRYWYLPAFLEIPHLYCDFLQVDSIPYSGLVRDFESIAVLAPPFAESLQACWTAFDSAVGLPTFAPASVESVVAKQNS